MQLRPRRAQPSRTSLRGGWLRTVQRTTRGRWARPSIIDTESIVVPHSSAGREPPNAKPGTAPTSSSSTEHRCTDSPRTSRSQHRSRRPGAAARIANPDMRCMRPGRSRPGSAGGSRTHPTCPRSDTCDRETARNPRRSGSPESTSRCSRHCSGRSSPRRSSSCRSRRPSDTMWCSCLRCTCHWRSARCSRRNPRCAHSRTRSRRCR